MRIRVNDTGLCEGLVALVRVRVKPTAPSIGGGEPMSEQLSIPTDTVLRLLADRQRRQVLRRIAETDDGTTVRRLGEQLGDSKSRDPTSNGDADAGISLRHVHLPKLREADVIEYDPRGERVRRGPHFEEVLSLLRLVESHPDAGTERP